MDDVIAGEIGLVLFCCEYDHVERDTNADRGATTLRKPRAWDEVVVPVHRVAAHTPMAASVPLTAVPHGGDP